MIKSLLISLPVLALALTSSAAPAAKAPAAKAPAAAAPLFANGEETFKLEDAKGQTPQFRLLDDTEMERALASAAIEILNANKDVQPKIPQGDHVDVKLETMKLSPVKGKPDEIEVAVRLSGHEVELSKTISKKKLLAGEPIQITFPKKTDSLAMVTIESNGQLNMRLDPAQKNLLIENASARALLFSSLGGSGSEEIQFSGKGVRLVR